jgi:uncharacterized protein (TIGR04141 family)
MRVNVFRIPAHEREAMILKLKASQLEAINSADYDGWMGTFYFSRNPPSTVVSWATAYVGLLPKGMVPTNRSYFAAMVLIKDTECYAVSYGKTHFYLRPFCDYDFGIEVAKRIADEDDIRQKATKRFQGRRRKDIRSYTYNSRLEVESGESVDYLQAAVTPECRAVFGLRGKFGTSVELNPTITVSRLGEFMNALEQEITKPARFALPRTMIISDAAEIERFDRLLIDELTSDAGPADFALNSYDLYGVDFVFTSEGSYTLSCPGYPKLDLDNLDISQLKAYITANELAPEDILRIKVRHQADDAPSYTHTIKEVLDFVADDERVLLTNGRWMVFNQDYLRFLDDFINEIAVEPTESQFKVVTGGEPAFNKSKAIQSAGYTVADTNFDIFQTRATTPIEAWDLQRDTTVYAVKFGTSQKLSYVCDQALAVLELLRNKAEVRRIPNFQSYCLWFGYTSKKPVTDIATTNSIIFKQKIEAWARKARDLGIEPVIKLSHKPDQRTRKPKPIARIPKS